MHAIFILSLDHLSLLGLQRPEDRATPTVQWFKSHNPVMSMSSMVNDFVHAICKHSQKVPHANVVCFGSLGPIPRIQ